MGPYHPLRGPRDRACRANLLKPKSRFCFLLNPLSKEPDMRRINLYEATMQGWGRLDPSQRERFSRAGLKAALRPERREFRAWLMRRLIEPPLAAVIDPASFAISKADIARRLTRSAREMPLKKTPQRNSEAKNANMIRGCCRTVPPEEAELHSTPATKRGN